MGEGNVKTAPRKRGSRVLTYESSVHLFVRGTRPRLPVFVGGKPADRPCDLLPFIGRGWLRRRRRQVRELEGRVSSRPLFHQPRRSVAFQTAGRRLTLRRQECLRYHKYSRRGSPIIRIFDLTPECLGQGRPPTFSHQDGLANHS